METLPVSVPETGRWRAESRSVVLVAVAILAVARGDLVAWLLPGPGGTWMLPRQTPLLDEALEDAALVPLKSATGAHAGYLEQIHTWGDLRDGAGSATGERVLEVGYLALSAGTWNGDEGRRREGQWWPIAALPPLIPEHGRILQHAAEALRRRLAGTNLAASLIPEHFTLSELQHVYEAVQGRQLDKRNFRKWVLGTGMIEATPFERRDGAHRPARLYRFVERELRFLEGD